MHTGQRLRTAVVASSRIVAAPPAKNTRVIPMSPEGAKRAGRHRSTYNNAATLRHVVPHAPGTLSVARIRC